MRILLLTADYPPDVWSGIGTAVQAQAAALARAGHAVTVLVGSRTPRLLPASTDSVTVAQLAGYHCGVNPAAFDVVHLHSLALTELALQMKRRFGVRLVYTAHSLLPAELEAGSGLARRAWSVVQAEVMRRCDHVVFLNHEERRVAIAALPWLQGRSSVVANGIAPAPVDIEECSPQLVLFAGRFTPVKGVFLLYEITKQVLSRSEAHFVFAGGHGEAQSEQALGRLAGLYPGRCQVRPWLRREALDMLLRRAALVLIPSLYEPFGLVALEAMRVGTPVLAAATGGLREIMGPEAGGRLVASHDAEEWAAQVMALLHAPDTRAELGSRGPGYVARHYNEEQWAARLATEVYG